MVHDPAHGFVEAPQTQRAEAGPARSPYAHPDHRLPLPRGRERTRPRTGSPPPLTRRLLQPRHRRSRRGCLPPLAGRLLARLRPLHPAVPRLPPAAVGRPPEPPRRSRRLRPLSRPVAGARRSSAPRGATFSPSSPTRRSTSSSTRRSAKSTPPPRRRTPSSTPGTTPSQRWRYMFSGTQAWPPWPHLAVRPQSAPLIPNCAAVDATNRCPPATGPGIA